MKCVGANKPLQTSRAVFLGDQGWEPLLLSSCFLIFAHTCTHSLMCFAYTQRSICAAPASSAVWFAPVPSSDTGTWLGLRWFAAGGAPADEAWHWRTPPPDGHTESGHAERILVTFYISRGTSSEAHAILFQQHSPLIGSQWDHSLVLFGTQGCFTGAAGG